MGCLLSTPTSPACSVKPALNQWHHLLASAPRLNVQWFSAMTCALNKHRPNSSSNTNQTATRVSLYNYMLLTSNYSSCATYLPTEMSPPLHYWTDQRSLLSRTSLTGRSLQVAANNSFCMTLHFHYFINPPTYAVFRSYLPIPAHLNLSSYCIFFIHLIPFMYLLIPTHLNLSSYCIFSFILFHSCTYQFPLILTSVVTVSLWCFHSLPLILTSV